MRPRPKPPSAARPSKAAGRPRLTLAALLGAAGLLAAACSSGDAAPASDPEGGVAVTTPEVAAEATEAIRGSRPAEGIAAAGGTAPAGGSCPADAVGGAPGTHTIAVVAPDIDRLGDIGLGDLVFDPAERIFEAYINEVNSLGGVNGNCFDFKFFEFGFTNPEEEIGAICAELPLEDPFVMFAFALPEDVVGCTTLAAQVPTIGLYSQYPEALFGQAAGLLFVDHGSLEFLLDNGVRNAVQADAIAADDAVAHLYSEDANAASIQATMADLDAALGFEMVASAGVPLPLEGTAAVVVSEQFRAAGGSIFEPSESDFAASLEAIPAELGQLMAGIRAFFLQTAVAMRDAGVTAVAASAPWDSVRNLMRAAEMIGWYPKWVINDSQFALITLTDAPTAQGANLVQISSRRAADDPIDGLDRGCLSLRNTGFAAEPFSHRFHTDAWSLLTQICDNLDVAFGAVSRVDGPLTRGSFLAALTETEYRTAHGQLLRFGPGDPFGSDSFRLLSADPDCVLNDWGCMRAVSDWLESVAAGAASGTGVSTDG